MAGQDVIVAKETPVFIKKRHELQSLLNDLKKGSSEALAVLQSGLKSQDEKIKMNTAKELLSVYIDLQKIVNQEMFNNLVAQIKLTGAPKNFSTVPEDSSPKLDFENISDEFRDKEITTVDMSTVKSIG